MSPVAPGVVFRDLEVAPPRSAPTDTGVWFAAGAAERGPVDRSVALTSFAQFTEVFGDRVSWSVLADSIETFFREGGGTAIVSRVVGPTPVYSSITLEASGAVDTLTVRALEYGTYWDRLTVQVVAGGEGGTFVLVIADPSGELERSPDLADIAAAVAWGLTSSYVRCIAVSTGDPVVAAATAMTGGSDDHASIVTASYTAALTRFGRDLGPGQVSVPGATAQALQTVVMDHAAANNRVALVDSPDTATVATITANAAALAALATARHGALFGPWVRIPGLVAGTVRTVPYSALQAGLIARADAQTGLATEAAAGTRGVAAYALGLSQTYTDAEYGTLNEAGVSMGRVRFGQVTTYGFRGLGSGVWTQFTAARLRMAIQAEAEVIATEFVFAKIDGRGLTQARLGGALNGMLLRYHAAGALYGETPDEAYSVDTSDAVNTPATKAEGELHAVITVRVSPFAELVVIELVSLPITAQV